MGLYVNQVGYPSDTKKVAVSTKEGKFQILSAGTDEVVFESTSTGAKYDAAAGEDAYIMDFSGLTESGAYYVATDSGEKSHQFVIADKPYLQVHKDMLKALYYQRCGCELKSEHAGAYTHAACHTAPAIHYADFEAKTENPKTYDMTGGWHDAGDFGRYSTPAAVALAHLLYAYGLFPESFQDTLQIPESGNDMPDVLNECMYELEWLLKMQAEDGGVYHKLTAYRHAPFVMPEEDLDTFLIYPVSSMAVADFAAVMALASRGYKAFRPEFAKEAREKAKKSWKWLCENPYVGFRNPEGSGTGEYDDICDEDERFWVACEMLCTDSDNREEYIEAIKKYGDKVGKLDFGWTDVSALGSLCLMTEGEKLCPEDILKNVTETVFAEADRLLSVQDSMGYGVAMKPDDYCWGSNMVVCNRGMLLALCAIKSDDDKAEAYKEGVLSQLHYLLGRNALDYSYVTGHGEHAFRNPHNRPTACDGIDDPMPGWVSGGPNKVPCDEAAVALIKPGTPPMKSYVDHVDSYSTNEITIYWNSPAIFMTAFLNA